MRELDAFVDTMSPVAHVLIGLPGSGKSHWRERARSYLQQRGRRVDVISSDDFIEQRAKALGKTYSEVFPSTIKDAERFVKSRVAEAFAAHRDVIWDRTNVSSKSRAEMVRSIPAVYRVVAHVFPSPPRETHERILAGREGKTIPLSIVDRMRETLGDVKWTTLKREGFDAVIEHPEWWR
jgi:predicted kinase